MICSASPSHGLPSTNTLSTGEERQTGWTNYGIATTCFSIRKGLLGTNYTKRIWSFRLKFEDNIEGLYGLWPNFILALEFQKAAFRNFALSIKTISLFESKSCNLTADRYGICSTGSNGIYPIPSRASQGMISLKVCYLFEFWFGYQIRMAMPGICLFYGLHDFSLRQFLLIGPWNIYLSHSHIFHLTFVSTCMQYVLSITHWLKNHSIFLV